MKQLFWKEWMELRYVPTVLTLALAAMVFLSKYFNAVTRDEWAATSMGMIMLLWPFAGLLAGCGVFSGEAGNGTLRFLSSLPVSRNRIWLVKFLSSFGVLCVSLLFTGALWFAAAACFGDIQKIMPNVAGFSWHEKFDALIIPLALPFFIYAVALFVSALVTKPLTSALITMAVCMALQGIYSQMSTAAFSNYYLDAEESRHMTIVLAVLAGGSMLVFVLASYWSMTHVRNMNMLKRGYVAGGVVIALTSMVLPTYAWFLNHPHHDNDWSYLRTPTTKGGSINTGFVFDNSAGAINCGGGAVGAFLADTEKSRWSDSGVSTYSAAIDTSGVSNPAPQSVYQSGRSGASMYSIHQLKPNAWHTVRLHFSENTFDGPGKRVFNVFVGGKLVLPRFDIFAAAGGAHKAIARTFKVRSDYGGGLGIYLQNDERGELINGKLTTVQKGVDKPEINGIEVKALPEPLPIHGIVRIKCGANAIGQFRDDGNFSTDGEFLGGGETATNYTGVIDTSGVKDPAPQAVYHAEHQGQYRLAYTIPGLTPGAPYIVRLHFCENYYDSANQRYFDVDINGKQALRNFDIFAAAGAAHKANIQQFATRPNISGQIIIKFWTLRHGPPMDGPLINAIEALPVNPKTASAATTARDKP